MSHRITEIEVVFREGKNPIRWEADEVGQLGYEFVDEIHHVSIITTNLEGINWFFDRDVVHHVNLVETGLEVPSA